jgi:hypothetical protein
MKDYKQKRDVISLDDLPENAIVVVTVEGSERVLGKRELLGVIERGLTPGINQPGISKAQESARIRHLLETIADGDLKAASVKIEELYGLGGPHYLAHRLFVQKVTTSVQKAKAPQKDKDALAQLLSQLYKGR